MIRRSLELDGHDVTEAIDGEEGLGLLAIRKPDLVVSGAGAVLDSLRDWLQALSREEARSEAVLEVLTRGLSDIPDEARIVQLRRQAEARARFLQEFPTLTAQEIARASGSRARNESALASRWKALGRLFTIQVDHVERFPVFQLDEDFRPRPIIARVLERLGGTSGWSVALWFVSGSGWLGGKMVYEAGVGVSGEATGAAPRPSNRRMEA